MVATVTIRLDDEQAAARFAELIHKAVELEQAVDSAQKKMNSPGWGNMAQKVTAVSTGFLAAVAAMKKASEVARQVGGAINDLAETGNPGARELVQSFSRLGSELEKIASSPEVTAFFKMMSQGITEGMLPALEQLPGKIREMEQAWVQFQMKQAGATQFQMDAVARLQAALMKAADEALKVERQRQEVQRQVNLAAADEAAVRQKLAEEVRRADLLKIKNTDVLLQLREKEIAKQKELAKQGELTDDLRRKGLSEIVLIEERRASLNREIVMQAVKEAEARKKWFDTATGQAKALADAFKQAYGKAADAAEKNLQAVIAKQAKAVSDLAEKIRAVSGGKEQDMLQSIRGKLDPRATLRQIAEDRARKAVQDVAGAGGDEREQRRAAVKARETAFRQARAGGRFNDAEVAQAQKELTQGVIDGAVQSGKLSETQAKALRQAAETVGQVAENQAQMQENIEQIERVMQEQLNLANQVNRRQRAQRSGG